MLPEFTVSETLVSVDILIYQAFYINKKSYLTHNSKYILYVINTPMLLFLLDPIPFSLSLETECAFSEASTDSPKVAQHLPSYGVWPHHDLLDELS